MLNLKQIRELYMGAFTSVRMFHADLLNSDYPMDLPDIAERYWAISKVHQQSDNLTDCLNSLHKKLTDFAAGNFDKYIEEHNKYAEDETDIFDPYKELRYSMNDSDWLYSLPSDINQYSDLLIFQRTNSERQKIQAEALKKFFPGLEWSIMSKDEIGNDIMVKESELPADVINRIEANREIHDIEVEYCLDNYNAWYQSIKQMIEDRRPFSEMLTLFKV